MAKSPPIAVVASPVEPGASHLADLALARLWGRVRPRKSVQGAKPMIWFAFQFLQQQRNNGRAEIHDLLIHGMTRQPNTGGVRAAFSLPASDQSVKMFAQSGRNHWVIGSVRRFIIGHEIASKGVMLPLYPDE